MRLSRSVRAALVLLFVATLGSFGPALEGEGCIGAPPCISTWLDFQQRTFSIEAWGGTPNGVGVLNFLVAQGANPGVVQMPITFDAYGEANVIVPLTQFNTGYDITVGIQLFTLDGNGEILGSKVWALRSHNYIVTDPTTEPCANCPTSPGGWLDWVLWPGMATGPLYPHTTVAIPSSEERSGGQPMLVLESGPAGSFPIN
jgi:hypothetical protein